MHGDEVTDRRIFRQIEHGHCGRGCVVIGNFITIRRHLYKIFGRCSCERTECLGEFNGSLVAGGKRYGMDFVDKLAVAVQACREAGAVVPAEIHDSGGELEFLDELNAGRHRQSCGSKVDGGQLLHPHVVEEHVLMTDEEGAHD